MELGWMTVSQDIHKWYTDMLTCMLVERVHWLRAKAQFERWMEEQDSIHNEAKWIPAYFHAKAESWRELMHMSAKGSLRDIKRMHHIRCMHGRSFHKAQLMPFQQLQHLQ